MSLPARSIPEFLRAVNASREGLPALRAPSAGGRVETTYGDLFRDVDRLARGLLASGVRRGDRVLLLADNSMRWMAADLGIQRAGAVCVPRAGDTTPEEVAHILSDSGATAAFLGRAGLSARLPRGADGLKFTACLDGDGRGLLPFADLLARGAGDGALPGPADLSTIVYTSGTTGRPKGVMLTHENVLHNVRVLPPLIGIHPGDRFLAVLPAWHMFERTVEYAALSCGGVLSYGSFRTLREDLRAERPQFLAAVPRLWEGIAAAFRAEVEKRGRLIRFLFRRLLSFTERRLVLAGRLLPERPGGPGAVVSLLRVVADAPFALPARWLFARKFRAVTGGLLRAAISGGGFLPLHLDVFYHALGTRLLVGYGLTETSPVVTLRSFERSVLGTIGRPIPETEVRITGRDGCVLAAGEVGEVEVRGPQVMAGYHGDGEATRRVLREDGFFRTGDLGILTAEGHLVFRGRAKETIVLSGGENVEPAPIEARILLSPFVRQVIVVGQDRKQLCALLVPEHPRAREEAEKRGVSLESLVTAEVRRLVSADAGFKPRECVARVAVLDSDFSIEDGTLTPTLKIRRNVVFDRYRDRIEDLYRR